MDVRLVKDVLILSSIVEVKNDWVRMGGNQWEQFVLPDAPASTVLDAKHTAASPQEERRVEHQEARVGVADDRRQLLALPLQDDNLLVEEPEAPLVVGAPRRSGVGTIRHAFLVGPSALRVRRTRGPGSRRPSPPDRRFQDRRRADRGGRCR